LLYNFAYAVRKVKEKKLELNGTHQLLFYAHTGKEIGVEVNAKKK
jgi:hypothetical protein